MHMIHRLTRFAAGLALALPFASPAVPLGGREDVERHPLPPRREGRFPVHVPETDGQVRQLLLVNHRWVVLAVYDVPEVVAQVDALSGGRLLEAVQTWEASEAAGRPNWTAFRLPGRLRGEFLARAREDLGERRLDEADAYGIRSGDDPAYAGERAPARVSRLFVSLGAARIPGAHEVDYAHYIFLELPEPMRNGHTYTFRVHDRGWVRFTYDERHAVSRAIKVNQVGYRPDAGVRMAYLGAFGYAFGPINFDHATEFLVIDVQSGETVLTGPVRLRERNPHFAVDPRRPERTDRPPMYGEDVYELDLSGLEAEGDFFITVPGVGRSWAFRHARDAYGEAFYIAARGFTHQRAATAIGPPHTVWARAKSPMHDRIHESDLTALPPQATPPEGFDRFDIIGATLDRDRVTEDVIGGWYDAADWDRNQTHYAAVFDMLNAYEHAPGAFTDGQLNLPESGDGVPDLLNEVAWGLECWRRSQDAAGGVSGFIETSTHPSYDNPDFPYAFSPRTRWSSLMYAAAAAQFARLVGPFDEEQAARYAASARRAWAFGIDPDHSLGRHTIRAAQRRGRGEPYTIDWEEKDEYVYPFRVHAALQLHRLSGDRAYLEGIAEFAAGGQPPFAWRFSHRDFSAWIYADLARDPEGALPAEVVDHWRGVYLREADALVERLADMPYRQTWPRHQDYWSGWGASSVVNFNRCLFIAWQLTGEPRYRDALILNADFMMGANPMGMSWTTGLGFVYPIDIQHHISQHDGIKDPVPGLSIYGINGGPAMHHRGRALVWASPGADDEPVAFISEANTRVPFYRRWSAHPRVNTAQCEFTVHETMAATMFTAAVLLEPGWMPDAELRGRGPRRDDLLFGYWPLP